MLTEEYWSLVSETARDFVSACLTINPEQRPIAAQMLEHAWLTSEVPHFVENETGEPRNLLPHVRRAFDAKKTCTPHVLFICGYTKQREFLRPERRFLA